MSLRDFFQSSVRILSEISSGIGGVRDAIKRHEDRLDGSGTGEAKQIPIEILNAVDGVLVQGLEVVANATKSTASDIHLDPGVVPYFRIDGSTVPMTKIAPWPVSWGDSKEVAAWLRSLNVVKFVDVEHTWGGWRFRMHYQIRYVSRKPAVTVAIRRLPHKIPDGLLLPVQFRDAMKRPQGFVVVSGPTGSGKTTTMAATVQRYLPQTGLHVVCYEDPIEYLHESGVNLIQQFELGPDFPSFASAMGKPALRKDPDVLIPGELRESEAVMASLDAADTGHLVFGTLHLSTAATVVDRITSMAGREYADKLAKSLSVVVCQTLIRAKQGGRVAAFEQLVVSDAMRGVLSKGDQIQMHLENEVRSNGLMHGSFSLEHSLAVLVHVGRISEEDAIGAASRPNDFRTRRAELLTQAKASPARLIELYTQK